jgi:hypothetical protein
MGRVSTMMKARAKPKVLNEGKAEAMVNRIVDKKDHAADEEAEGWATAAEEHERFPEEDFEPRGSTDPGLRLSKGPWRLDPREEVPDKAAKQSDGLNPRGSNLQVVALDCRSEVLEEAAIEEVRPMGPRSTTIATEATFAIELEVEDEVFEVRPSYLDPRLEIRRATTEDAGATA